MTDVIRAEVIPPLVPAKRTFLGCGCLAWAGGVFLLVIIVMLLLPAFPTRYVASRMQCENQIRQIGLAMLNYEHEYGCLPPAYVADAKGHPLHSWRVLILPYMELNDLYKKIRLDEPRNSPQNRLVLQGNYDAVRKFHCPFAGNLYEETSYVMIVGPNMISDGPHSVRLADMKDGASNTILVAEIKDSGIPWAEPRDLDFESMSFQVNDANGKGISSDHGGNANVVFADGLLHIVRDWVDPKLVKALITINGGEDVSEFNYR